MATWAWRIALQEWPNLGPLAIYLWQPLSFFSPTNFVFFFKRKIGIFLEKKNSSVNLTEFFNVWKKNCQFDGPTKDQGFYYYYYYYYYFNFLR
jgi:hypothetical protein